MNPTLVTAMIAGLTSLLSATAALFGVYLGRSLDMRSDRMRADRDRMVESYQKLITEYFSLRECLWRVALTEPTEPVPDYTDGSTAEVRAAGIEWNRAVFGVWLNGSRSVALHVRKLDEFMNALCVAAEAQQYGSDEWHEVRAPAQRSMDEYLDLVRSELDLAPHKIVSDYKP